MKESQIYREQIDTLTDEIKAEFTNLEPALLYKRPAPSANNPGFLYWHILRIWDLDLNHRIKREDAHNDAWHRGGYTEKSGYNPDEKGPARLRSMGLGYSDADVDEVNIPLDVLTAYHDQLSAETNEYLESASNDELRAGFSVPARPGTMTPADRFQHLVAHSYGHVGDIRFAKGLLGYTDPTYPKDEAKVAS